MLLNNLIIQKVAQSIETVYLEKLANNEISDFCIDMVNDDNLISVVHSNGNYTLKLAKEFL